MTRKGWTPATLDRLGVGVDGQGRYVFTIRDETGEYVGVLHYADDGREPKMRAERGTTRDLWPRPEDVAGTFVVVVEGEPDAVSAAELGLPAVALPGTGKWRDEWPERIASGRDGVYFVTDCDDVGRTRMKRAAELAARTTDAFVIDMAPDRTDGYDIGDALVELGPSMTRRFLDRLFNDARPVQAPIPAVPPDVRVPVVIRGSEVRIRPVRYLWRPWLPLGKVVILAGAPGQGKSQVAAFMAAATTTAGFLDGDVNTPANVVFLTAEDDLADTVAPRLLACGADMARWEAIVMRRTLPKGITADGLIKLPGDLDTLIERLDAGGVRLVVFDPVASFVGRDHSTYVNQDVRDVLDPVVAVAAHYGVAVVLVMHLNKSESKTWATKIGESHAFQAVARTVVAVAPDPDDEDGEEGVDKIMAPTKMNLVRRERGLALKYRLTTTTVYDDDLVPVPTSMIAFTGHSSVAADDLLADQGERGVRREVLDFLLDALADGPVASNDLKADAKKLGVAWRSIQRYYREVCKSAKRAKSATGRMEYVYELTADHGRTSTLGATGALGTEDDPTTPETPGVGVRQRSDDVVTEGNGELGEHGAHGADDLEWYRRRRDAMLGERWEDDE